MLELMPSRYNVVVPLSEGRALAYNGSRGGLAIWSRPERTCYERVSAGDLGVDPDDPIIDDMVTAGYLVGRNSDELSDLEKQYEARRRDPRVLSWTIAPTLACNFGCDYCYEGHSKPSGTMGPEVQDALIDHLRSVAPEISGLSVTWYGGEPLLRKQLVYSLSDRLIETCTEHGIEYSAGMVSNGYLLDVETARMLVERRVSDIQITLDGVPADHDRRRHLLGGQKTFRRIAENLQAVVEATPELHVSIRVNIDRRNRARVRDLVDHLHALGLGGRSNFDMYFAAVDAAVEASGSIHDACIDGDGYAELETDLVRHAYDKELGALPYPEHFAGICSAVSARSYVLVPNGDIHKCWDTVNDPRQATGSIFDVGRLARGPAASQWDGWTPFENRYCRNCRLLPSCAGGCAHKFVRDPRIRDAQVGPPCPSWKYSIKERLLLRAEKMGAVGRSDYDPDAVRTDPAELWVDSSLGANTEIAPSMQPSRTSTPSLAGRRLPVVY